MITLPRLLALSLLGGSVWTGAILPVVLTPARQTSLPAAIATREPTPPALLLANPDAFGRFHGDGVTPPVLIHSANPKYSRRARRSLLSGTCLVGLTVQSDGLPTDVHVVKSLSEDQDASLRDAALSLDESSLRAVERYRFKPATYQGKPVPVELRVQVQFNIR